MSTIRAGNKPCRLEGEVKYDVIRLDAEQQFSTELRELFQMPVVGSILEDAKVESESNPYLAFLQGQSFKVTPTLAPRFSKLCKDVQASLQFEEPVEFFIRSSQELNAGASPRMRAEDPHVVVFNSAILERFNDDEMRFIVGHELGHLISKNAELTHIIRFIFPDHDSIPTFFKDKIDTWVKLSEMSADRFGFIAMPRIDVCQSVFFKLSSGLDTERIDFDEVAYRAHLDEVLKAFQSSGELSGTSHPINPIRMKAIEAFAESDLLAHVMKGGTQEVSDEQLAKSIEPLVEILVTKGASPLTMHRKVFLASAGILVASADKRLTGEEVEHIVSVLSNTTHYPKKFVEAILNTDNIGELFARSVQAILEINPGERWPMLIYMINVASADRILRSEEVELLYDVGEKLFDVPRKEVAQAIANEIQSSFVPRIVKGKG